MHQGPSLPVVVLTVAALAASVPAQSTVRASVATAGTQSDSHSNYPVVSADGRFVAFDSTATNLVAGDTNNQGDVFVRDLHAGITTRVSVATGGTQANSYSSRPVLSADGRFVVFVSAATNLVASDTNGLEDVFVHDRQTGVTTCASVSPGGTTGAFGHSQYPSLSADGRYVVFHSGAQDLVPGDTNSVNDVFLRDLQTGTTTRISVRSDGTQTFAPSDFAKISGDGTQVAFKTSDSLLPSDPWNTSDLWVKDLTTGTLSIVSRTLLGAPSPAGGEAIDLSTDGRFVLFSSGANDLVAGDVTPGGDYFVRDMLLGTTEFAVVTSTGAQVLNTVWRASMSSDGRKIAFAAMANNVVPGDTNNVSDAFVRDRWLATVVRASVSTTGTQANGETRLVAISAEGRHATFLTGASNLVTGDTNGVQDVFVRDTELAGCGTGGVASTYGGTFQTGNAAFGFQVTGADPGALLVLDFGFATPGLECGACILTAPVVLVTASNVSGTGQFGFSVPSDPSYIGPTFEFQWLSFFTAVSPCPLLGSMSATGRVRFSAIQ